VNGHATNVTDLNPFTESVLPLASPFTVQNDDTAIVTRTTMQHSFVPTKRQGLFLSVQMNEATLTRALETIPDVNAVNLKREEGTISGFKWVVSFEGNIGE